MQNDFQRFPFYRLIRPLRWQAFEMPRVQSHRGLWVKGLQENTLEAFRAAKAAGFAMLECDVRLSQDRVPVVFHDETIARFAKDGGDRLVSEMKVRELKEQVNAPTLQEVLLDPSCPALINLELKSKEVGGGQLERQVAQLVDELGVHQRLMFSSFNPFSLWKISQYLPDVPRALLVSQADDPANHWLLKTAALAPLLSLHMLNLDYKMVDIDLAHRLLDLNIPFSVWTVNEPDQVRHFLNLGARSVITDLELPVTLI